MGAFSRAKRYLLSFHLATAAEVARFSSNIVFRSAIRLDIISMIPRLFMPRIILLLKQKTGLAPLVLFVSLVKSCLLTCCGGETGYKSTVSKIF